MLVEVLQASLSIVRLARVLARVFAVEVATSATENLASRWERYLGRKRL